MAEGVDFELRLRDALSGPASRAAAALKPVEDKLREVNQQLGSSAIDKMNDGLRKQQAQLRLQRSELAANLRAARAQEAQERRIDQAGNRARAQAAREERMRGRAAESQARLEGRAKASADRALQRSAQQRAQIEEGVRRRQVAALASSARQEQAAQQRASRLAQRQAQAKQQADARALAASNRQVAADNAQRIKAERRAIAEMTKVRDQGGGEKDGLVGGLSGLSGQAGLLLKIASAAAVAAAAVVALGAAFARAVIDAMAFREAAIGGLEQVMKGADAARKTFDVGVKLSARWNLDPRETVTQLQDLVSKGFSATDAKVLLTASADLKVMNPNANIAGIMLAIGQIRSKGVLQMEELQGQLAEAGINVGKTLEIIGKRLGKSSAEVRKMISAGKIDSKTGIWAIVKSIEEMGGGKLGSAADKASKSISSMMAGLQFRPGLIGLKLAEMLEGGPAQTAVRGALQNLLAATDPEKSPGMKRLLAGARNLANELLGMLFGPLASADGAKGLQYVLDRAGVALNLIASGIRSVSPLVQGFLAGFGEGASLVLDVLLAVGKSLGFGKDLSSAAGAARMLGKGLAIVLGVVGAVVVGLVAASASVVAFVQAMASAPLAVLAAASALQAYIITLPGQLLASGTSMGQNLWQGFVNGITAGIAAVTDAGTRLANAAKSAVGNALTIQSPSRVMMEMGNYTAQGFAQGVEGGQAQVDGAMSNLVTPKPALMGLGSSSTSQTLNAGGVVNNISITGAGDVTARDIGAESAGGTLGALEDILAQMGLGPVPA